MKREDILEKIKKLILEHLRNLYKENILMSQKSRGNFFFLGTSPSEKVYTNIKNVYFYIVTNNII